MDFYSRPCGRGDPKRRTRRSWPAYFYSRPCGRGDKGRRKRETGHDDHFYSRPCGRGDYEHKQHRRAENISTHAPAGGATRSMINAKHVLSVFLLTPLREGRPEGLGQGFDREIFLLTPLREGRPRSALICQPAQRISTHAPAGGATCWSRNAKRA